MARRPIAAALRGRAGPMRVSVRNMPRNPGILSKIGHAAAGLASAGAFHQVRDVAGRAGRFAKRQLAEDSRLRKALSMGEAEKREVQLENLKGRFTEFLEQGKVAEAAEAMALHHAKKPELLLEEVNHLMRFPQFNENRNAMVWLLLLRALALKQLVQREARRDPVRSAKLLANYFRALRKAGKLYREGALEKGQNEKFSQFVKAATINRFQGMVQQQLGLPVQQE